MCVRSDNNKKGDKIFIRDQGGVLCVYGSLENRDDRLRNLPGDDE